jgi:hypothetical protein
MLTNFNNPGASINTKMEKMAFSRVIKENAITMIHEIGRRFIIPPMC